MATDVEIPELGESVSEAILVEWLKKDGDAVEADEPLAVIETDKADAELPAPVAGVLRRSKKEGETVQVGEAIGQIEENGSGGGDQVGRETSGEDTEDGKMAGEEADGEATDASAKSDDASDAASGESEEAADEETGEGDGRSRDKLSPAVRRLVEEHDLDPAGIEATGRGGRLTKEDVVNYLEARSADDASERSEDTEEEKEGSRGKQDAQASGTARKAAAKGGTRREPMSRIRKRIAANLVQAQQQAAMLTTFNEVDMSSIMDLRAELKERFSEVHGVSLGLMSFFVRAAVLSLREFENVNASIDGDDVVYHDYVNMGIAVSTPRGLVVPVLKNAQAMSFAEIESEIKRVASRARDGKLGVDEMSGGTFTITNGGVFGSMLSTPILMPPQTGILGMHAIKDRPVAVGESVEVRPVMFLALTYDHRLVDGRDSVTFLVRMKDYLEAPARMMLEV